MYRLTAEPAIIEVRHGLVGVLLAAELDVDVADQVVTQVVAHVHLLDLAKLVGREAGQWEEESVKVRTERAGGTPNWRTRDWAVGGERSKRGTERDDGSVCSRTGSSHGFFSTSGNRTC